MRIVFVGVGALGSYFGGALAAAGHDITLVIRNEAHRSAILANGLRLVLDSGEPLVHPRVVAPDDVGSEAPADILVIFCKTGATRDVLKASSPLIGPETRLVSAQNGLGNDRVLGEFVPRDRVIYGTTMAPGDLRSPGIVESHGSHLTQIRAATDDETSRSHAAHLAHALDAAGVPTIINEDVDTVIWAKVAFNCAMNSLCALNDLRPGPLLDSPGMSGLVRATVTECCDVAEASGIIVDRDELESRLQMVQREHRDHIPSMLHDIRSQRRTEIDALNGAVVALGAQHGVPTPYNHTLLALVRQREADYSA